MAFETKNFMVFKKISLSKNQVEKECSVELEGEVIKILTASAQVDLLLCEVSEGEISYTGELTNCVVYSTADNKIGSTNSVCEFTGKIEDDKIKAGDKAILSLGVKECSVSYENEKAVVKATLEERVELLTQKEVKNIDCGDDDICTKKGVISLEKFVGEGKRESYTEEEIVARANVKKIVSLEPGITLKSIDAQKGYVTVSGETITRLIYLTEDDKFESAFINCAFKEEIEVENCDVENRIECKVMALHKGCTADVLESDKGTKILVKTPFVINAYVFGKEEVNTIEDMYSTTSEITMSSESFDMTRVCFSENLDTKIDGSLTLSDEKPRVDKIIFTGANSINVTNSYVSNNELFVEGIAKTTVVYLNDDEGSLNSVEIEIPFALSDKTQASDEAEVFTEAVLYDTDVVVKKGRELFFDGKVKVNARVCENEISATITGAERGEAYLEKDCAMQYVVGKAGEELWQVAKRNKVKEEQLISQNSDVVFPLIQDTGFILFFQKLL